MTQLQISKRSSSVSGKFILPFLVALFLLLHDNGNFGTVDASTVACNTRRRSAGDMSARMMAPMVVEVSSTSAVSTGTMVAESTGGGGGNVVTQLFGYLKDSIVRTIDGCGQMWANHGTCNQIRAKQRVYREKLKSQWENENKLTVQEIKQQLRSINGGISYDEYAFLNKGKEDRSKLFNIIFLMWGAPRFLPYALMFYPEMLPSPFAPISGAGGGAGIRETKLEKLSRERSHAVLKTMLNIEVDAQIIPYISKLNIFGRKSQQMHLDKMGHVGQQIGQALLSTSIVRGGQGAKLIMNQIVENNNWIYSAAEFNRAQKRIANVPKAIIKGVAIAIEGPNPLNLILPAFMARGKVITHLKKIEEADEFLVHENIDLSTIDSTRLMEACNLRFIGGPSFSDEELRSNLQVWLDLTVIQPATIIQQQHIQNQQQQPIDTTADASMEQQPQQPQPQLQYYNGNMARFILLCYYALDGTRDSRSASYLPRLLYEGQPQPAT